MATKFFTNVGSKTLLEKFKGIFEHNTDIERFDALVGLSYGTSSGEDWSEWVIKGMGDGENEWLDSASKL
jgi:hypothetical protein